MKIDLGFVKEQKNQENVSPSLSQIKRSCLVVSESVDVLSPFVTNRID